MTAASDASKTTADSNCGREGRGGGCRGRIRKILFLPHHPHSLGFVGRRYRGGRPATILLHYWLFVSILEAWLLLNMR